MRSSTDPDLGQSLVAHNQGGGGKNGKVVLTSDVLFN